MNTSKVSRLAQEAGMSVHGVRDPTCCAGRCARPRTQPAAMACSMRMPCDGCAPCGPP